MSKPSHADHFDAEHDPQAMAVELEPVLREATAGRLGPIEWFRSSWQQGGAATGFSTWTGDDGNETETMVKLPVGSREHYWTFALSESKCIHSPRVIAHGTALGNYDLAWMVLERLRGKTLGRDLTRECVLSFLGASCDVHLKAASIKPATAKDAREPTDWERLLDRAIEAVVDNAMPDENRWLKMLKLVQSRLGVLVGQWRARTIDTWCHGDLHPGNALYRGPGVHEGEVVLIDFALMHTGHWIEDALYLERLYWGHESLLHGVKPVSLLGKLRKQASLPVETDDSYLANVRRVLMASCVPAFLAREGNPLYVAASLDILERLGNEILR